MRLLLLLLMAFVSVTAKAQAGTPMRVPGAMISGVVRDSIARVPLVGAVVQLVAADSVRHLARVTISDSLGRYTLADVPAGRYTLGFFHPMLDSLGLEPILRAVSVNGRDSAFADLAIPSSSRLRTAICGKDSALSSDLRAVVVGVVHDARSGTPVGGAKVAGEWLEISFRPGGIVRNVPRLVATTRENGWFAICDVPNAGTMALRASHGVDSSGVIEVHVPDEGFVRREMYVGIAPRESGGTSATPADTSLRQRPAPGRLRGSVIAAEGGLPLGGAVVRITGGPQTIANDRGEWTLAAAPSGTHMLEVRAIGYYPDRRAVHVIADAVPVVVVMSTLRAVLDTIKVRAVSLRAADLRNFEERRRSGVGRYLNQADVTRLRPLVTSEIFRRLAGVRLGDVRDVQDHGSQKILVRGNMSEWCEAAIFLNGKHLGGISGSDLDDWLTPGDIAGVEIYSGPGAPVEFQALVYSGSLQASRCGSILIWTKK